MPNAHDERNEANSRRNSQEKPNNMRQWIWNTFFKDRSAAWTAIFTGVLVFFTYKLYQVTDRADDTTRATQRAFVSFSGIAAGVSLVSPDSKTKTAQEILVNWTNSGNTPARNAMTKANGNAWPGPGELPQGYDFPDSTPGSKQPITLGPRETSGIRAVVPIEYFRTAREGKSRLYIWGWIVYDDVFSSDLSHLTEFCTEMIHIAIPSDKDIADPNAPLAWITGSCKEGNCTDQDCKDYSTRIKEARAK